VLTPEFVKLTRCLHTGSQLHVIDAHLLEQINRAVSEGRLQNRLGNPVGRRLDTALVNETGSLAYPVFDDIPVLLRDEAIDLHQLADSPKTDQSRSEG
jgi:uncharacterized protein YbaR (Trm112 family)